MFDNGRCRKLTPNEYRKLQTIPDWYKMNVSDSQIYNMCGDGWSIEVIKHIFKGLIESQIL
ncbi:MAG: DNA cytosine methyltransferase [Bacteroidales bacterium]|nr:DNA cytosine methyltransferase [Bacteroidales bacterium]